MVVASGRERGSVPRRLTCAATAAGGSSSRHKGRAAHLWADSFPSGNEDCLACYSALLKVGQCPSSLGQGVGHGFDRIQGAFRDFG